MTISLASLGGGGVKSVQRGLATISTTVGTNVTISAVDMSKTFVAVSYYGTTNTSQTNASIQLTTPTNILLKNGGGGTVTEASWQVVEYN